MNPSRIAAVLALACQLVAGTPALADISTGFGGIEWSSAPDPGSACEPVGRKGDVTYCVRRGQAHTLLGEPMDRVTYGYHRDRFFAVFVRIENDDLQDRTRRRIVKHLGTPQTEIDKDGRTTLYRWAMDSVALELYENGSEAGFQLAFYYLPIAEKAGNQRRLLFPPKRPKAKLFPIRRDDMPDALRILEF